jgi:hypothetical protein
MYLYRKTVLKFLFSAAPEKTFHGFRGVFSLIQNRVYRRADGQIHIVCPGK